MLNKEQVLELGFKELPHFTITNSLIFDLGRNRQLSIGNIGTPNEMLFIGETDNVDKRKITDLVCLSNYDYDGYLTLEKVTVLLSFFGENKNK